MKKFINAAFWAVKIALGLGSFMVFNDSDTFMPNFLGIVCIAALVAVESIHNTYKQVSNQ